MLIEIHMIQNHSPANLNRDDLGAPKTCIFGGVTRARISSQCLKRSIRRSPEFAAALEKAGGVRTRRLASLLARIAHSGDFDLTPEQLANLLQVKPEENEETEELYVKAAKALEMGGVKAKNKTKSKSGDDEDASAGAVSNMLLFLSTKTIGKMAKDLKKASNANELANQFKEYIAETPCVPDIALNGRMTEVAKNGVFSDLNFTVEAALSAAHAISTHAVVNEVDYFTAADDVPGQDAGAAHVDEAMFNSACFYKHFVIDFEQLKKNLANEADLACKTVRCFIEAAAKANPSGKQHAFAAFNPPNGVLVEVKTKSATPVNYANAFADPVPDKSERGLIGESIARFGQYVHDLATGYGIEAERFWFSPNLRHHLTWIDTTKKAHEQEQSVVGTNEFGEFEAFVKTIMDKMETTGTPPEAAK
ncbi:MAG: type I-E CRISPR-associated protein Cas7/Cse4/CasC [Synergistaceae bacterium]|nr:type I-E CRISPR-associated protein Cas7/Cse4/CasC [Synergistaceae bacterium]